MDTLLLLEAAGLTKNAARIYLTALQLGPSTMTELSCGASKKRPSVYLMVDDLLMRGFMSKQKSGKKTIYRAEHPQKILQLLRARTREMERVIPELEAMYYEPGDRPRVTVFEGLEALVRVYDDMYATMGKRGEVFFFTDIENLIIHVPEAIDGFIQSIRDLPPSYRLRELDRESPVALEYIRRIRSVRGKHHHIRLLDSARFPYENTDTLIFENKTVLFSFRKEVFTVVIESQQIADTHRAMFLAAWEMGKETE